jgi:hypothetical protein
VSDPSPLLDRAGIEEAFRRLGDRLARRGVVADLYVFGGAAMALAYDSRRATRDVDALFKPHGIVLEEALAVAAELDLPRWWLNEQARFLCRAGRGLGGLPGIRPPGPSRLRRLSRASPGYESARSPAS